MPTHYDGDATEKRALDVYIKLFRASTSVANACQSGVIATGLTMSQFGALETVLHLGPLTISQIAEKHLMSRNNLTVVVHNLEKAGYVRLESCESDRRAIMVHLTSTGESTVRTALLVHVADVKAAMKSLTAREQETLCRLLKKLGTSLA